ncbi:MAG TPA: hypothetical protein VIT91_19710 [Chthoniobacterales bacterium]
MQLTPQRDFKVVLGLIAVVAVPAVVALLSARVAQKPVLLTPQPSFLGYTRSLSLFISPILAVLVWLHIHRDFRFQRRAFYWTVIPLALTGFLLDFVFGTLFFQYPNREATLGCWLPGWDWNTLRIEPDRLPLEEFVFYATGFMAVLLIYLWCDEYWFGAYNVPDYRVEANKLDRVIHLHWPSLWIGVALIAAGWLYKNFGPVSDQRGFPGYFTFLVVAAIVPSILLYDAAKRFINWRAVSFTFFMILLVSLLWEATLAVPYGWWGYEPGPMLGIYVYAWTKLPLEAVILWMAVTFTTVIVYEVVKILCASDRGIRRMLTGK